MPIVGAATRSPLNDSTWRGLRVSCQGSFNSGQRAIELAIYRGARRVLLVGYDCSIRDGAHWHGAHAGLANPDAMSVARWHDEFRQLRDWAVGVEIINCSRRTRLRCFQRQSLEVALSSI